MDVIIKWFDEKIPGNLPNNVKFEIPTALDQKRKFITLVIAFHTAVLSKTRSLQAKLMHLGCFAIVSPTTTAFWYMQNESATFSQYWCISLQLSSLAAKWFTIPNNASRNSIRSPPILLFTTKAYKDVILSMMLSGGRCISLDISNGISYPLHCNYSPKNKFY